MAIRDRAELAAMCDAYRQARLSETNALRSALSSTAELRLALTEEIVSRNRAVIETVSPENQSPSYDPVFLTFLDYPEWIESTDRDLQDLKADFVRRPTEYKQFIKQLAQDPTGRLFELSLYSILRKHFPVAVSPRLPGSPKSADIEVTVDGQTVAIEATVLRESDADREERDFMTAQGLTTWSGSRDIDAEPRRLFRKVVEKLKQTSRNGPNVLMVAVHMPATIEQFYEGAIADAFAGTTTLAADVAVTSIDSELVARVDSAFLCTRQRVRKVLPNPAPGPGFGLSDKTRSRLLSAFDGESFRIR